MLRLWAPLRTYDSLVRPKSAGNGIEVFAQVLANPLMELLDQLRSNQAAGSVISDLIQNLVHRLENVANLSLLILLALGELLVSCNALHLLPSESVAFNGGSGLRALHERYV